MKLALYKAPGAFTNKLIRLVTRGPYSHCEIVFSDAMRAHVKPENVLLHDVGGSLCFSSSSWAPRYGCAFENIDVSDGKWDLIDLAVTGEQERAALDLAIADVGRGYDWPGIAGFLLPHFPDDRGRRFCSEECVYLAQRAGLLSGVVANKTSPNGLYRILEKT